MGFQGKYFVLIFSNLQIWHQLKTRKSKYSIAAHEDSFFLALKEDKNTLKITKKYSFPDSARSLTLLSFFIAISFMEQNDHEQSSGADAPQTVPSVLHNNPGGSYYPSGGSAHHQRSDSDTTITGRSPSNILDSLATFKMYLLIFFQVYVLLNEFCVFSTDCPCRL